MYLGVWGGGQAKFRSLPLAQRRVWLRNRFLPRSTTGRRGAPARTVHAAASRRVRRAIATAAVMLGAAVAVGTAAGTAVVIVVKIAVMTAVVVAAVSAVMSAGAAARTAGHQVDARAPPLHHPTAGATHRHLGLT